MKKNTWIPEYIGVVNLQDGREFHVRAITNNGRALSGDRLAFPKAEPADQWRASVMCANHIVDSVEDLKATCIWSLLCKPMQAELMGVVAEVVPVPVKAKRTARCRVRKRMRTLSTKGFVQ